MKHWKWGIAALLCVALTVGMLAGIALPASAAMQPGRGDTGKGDELPIIPINPHTHTWDAGTVTTEPTCTEPGVMTYHCTTCSTGVKTVPINPLGHAYQAAVTAPTCTDAGYTTYACTRCGDSYTADETEALGHDYQAAVTAPTCTAGGFTTYTCSRCGDRYVDDETEALGHDYQAAVTAPTCTAGGFTTYTCTRCGSSYIGDEQSALGHVAGEPAEENRTQPSCTENGGYDSVICCTVCGLELQRSHTDLPALGHDWDDGVVSTAPTCTGAGVTVYTCRRCGETKQEAASAVGHTPGEAATENELAATCTTAGGYDTVVRCTVCGVILSAEHTELPALGHSYDDVITAPTCLEAGCTIHTCTVCGDSYRDGETAALGHDFGEWTESVAPGCVEAGMERRDCSRCDAFETRELPALGHSYEAVVTAPTCVDAGFTTHTCTVCGDSYQDEPVPAAGHQFVSGVCTVCGAKDPDYEPVNPFTDVSKDQYFYDAVLWAVENGITKGTGADTFSPGSTCTRGHVVTFLWRAKGSPEPTGTENPFTDVKESDYFFKAVLWAKQTGVTSGTSATAFSPGKGCTRAQVVTFLWRAEGKPESDGANNPFRDVPAGQYYTDAVLWAVANGITSGTSATTFSPDKTCTRGQIVTFLYRDLG